MGRATVDQVRQIGKETTAGTLVAASKRLPALSLNLAANVEKENFTALGYKGVTASAITGLSSTGGYEGPLCYNHLTYPLDGMVGSAGPTGGTLAKTWVFSPASAGSDSLAKTFSAEAGDASAARTYSRLRFRSMQIAVARRSGSRVSGSLYANFPTDGQVLTGSPTVITPQPVGVLEWDIYMDTSFGALGTTKVANAYAANFNVGDKFNPFWRLNSADAGAIADEAEIPHEITAAFSMMHDAQSRATFATISTNPTRYFRFLATGPIIESATRYKIQLDFAAQFTNPGDDDNNGIFGQNYGLQSIYDASLGGHWKVTLVNILTGT